jgi:hypothetical protein
MRKRGSGNSDTHKAPGIDPAVTAHTRIPGNCRVEAVSLSHKLFQKIV